MSNENSPVEQITSKITAFEVVKKDQVESSEKETKEREAAFRQDASEIAKKAKARLKRPEVLLGATYRVKGSHDGDHSLYVTINDIIIDAGTEKEKRRPFEIFFTSKDPVHAQWMNGLALLASAVFKNALVMSEIFEEGGDVEFVADQLKSVFDPRGGHYAGGGKFVSSLVAQIGLCLENHLVMIGALKKEALPEATKAILEEKKKAFLAANADTGAETSAEIVVDGKDEPAFEPIKGASICGKCGEQAAVVMDGCEICLNCGNSKCQ